MAKIFKIFATFYTGLFENIYTLLDSFDALGGDAYTTVKDALEKILAKPAAKEDAAADAAE